MRISSAYQRYSRYANLLSASSSNTSSSKGVSVSGVTTPDYDGMLTKRKPAMSEGQYKAKIAAQARADAASGTFHKSSGYQALEQSYVSCVSPDRKTIITSTMKSLSGRMPSSMTFYDSNGNKVADWNTSKHCWEAIKTPVENARQAAFNKIYNKAYEAAKNGQS